MPQCYDLHTHTLCSDGTLTPSELVTRAKAQGVDVLALTDHDVTDGVAEATATAAVCGLKLIPGVEVSVTWQNMDVHVVGLNIEPECAPLQDGLARLREFRQWRAFEIDRRLKKKNIHGAYEYVQAHARGAIIARTHFARFLVDHNYVRDTGRAFKHYLGRGAPAYVPGQWATLAEAIEWIRAAGGIAVIAHPARYKLTSGKLRRLLDEFRKHGGQGIEVISGSHGPQDNLRFADIATEYDLLGSVGSDYHGPEKPWVELGHLTPLPESCTPVWRDWNVSVN